MQAAWESSPEREPVRSAFSSEPNSKFFKNAEEKPKRKGPSPGSQTSNNVVYRFKKKKKKIIYSMLDELYLKC